MCETALHDYDIRIGIGIGIGIGTVRGETLDKSLRVLKPGGTVISVTGPSCPTFAREIGANPVAPLAMAALSYRFADMPDDSR